MSDRQKPVSPPKITVIGSINCDFTTFVDQFPLRNQTVMAKQFAFNVGGKGLNQAVAAARVGADVSFVGCVGADGFGDDALAYLNRYGIDTSHVQRVNDESTGSAGIFVSAGGENMIAVTPGANARLERHHIESARDLIEDSDVLLVQLEIPYETVECSLSLAKSSSTFSILNPAPILPNALALASKADIVTPNETEMLELLGAGKSESPGEGLAEIKQRSQQLASQGVATVITTLGPEGCLVFTGSDARHIPSHEVSVVDPTGAGDVFNGVLAAYTGEGYAIEDAAQHAVAAAAMSVEKETVCDAAPSRDALEVFLANKT